MCLQIRRGCFPDALRFRLTALLAGLATPGPGPPRLLIRLVVGLFILKHMHNLSDEVRCERWLENPYYQFFCGELSFCHRLPFDRSSLTHWRRRLGEEQLVALIQENLSVAPKPAIPTSGLVRGAGGLSITRPRLDPPFFTRLDATRNRVSRLNRRRW